MSKKQKNSISMILNAFKEIFPPFLLLLVFIPIVIGFIIDYELSEARFFIVNLVWIPLFTIPFNLSHKRIFYQIASIVYYLVGLIEISHWIILKGPLTLTSLLVISNTNFQEAIDFFDLKASAWLFILLPYTYLLIYNLRLNPILIKSKLKPFIIVIVLLFSAGFIFENALHGRFIRKGTPQFLKVTLNFITQRNLFKEAMKELPPRKLNARSTILENSQTFVLILGESCNRNHMSIYGASRKTNPKLEKRNDLIVYTNVVAPYSNTLSSLLSMLSNSNLEKKLSFDSCIDILDVFHSAGFKTYWISNQSPIGIWDNMVTVLAKKSDYFKFVNTTGSTSFESILTKSYDSKLFEPFSQVLQEDVGKKFIVLHLMGSHASYSKRYPGKFNIFSGNNKKEKTIAEYDNSVLYNDYIVDSLLNIIISTISSNNNHIASAIYISDHGENVYDEIDRVGHDYSNELPNANVEVPFVVWLSSAYSKLNPDRITNINSNINKPYVSDDLFHSIIDLNGIQTEYLNEERSIFSDRFNDKRLRILEDGKDYDRKSANM